MLTDGQKQKLELLEKGQSDLGEEYIPVFKARVMKSLEKSFSDLLWIMSLDKNKKIFTGGQDKTIIRGKDVQNFVDLYTGRCPDTAQDMMRMIGGKVDKEDMIELVKDILSKKQFHQLFMDILDQQAAVELLEDRFPTARVRIEIGNGAEKNAYTVTKMGDRRVISIFSKDYEKFPVGGTVIIEKA